MRAKTTAHSIDTAVCKLNKQAALDRLGGDEELFNTVCGIYLKESPDKIKNLECLDPKNDLGKLASSAHSIKGNCATIGAELCQNAAYNLEMAARRGQWQEVPELIKRLKAEMLEIEQVLKNGG